MRQPWWTPTPKCANVLLAGWDVAITPGGLYLLEANLSCNFFRASLDRQQYSFVGEAIAARAQDAVSAGTVLCEVVP